MRALIEYMFECCHDAQAQVKVFWHFHHLRKTAGWPQAMLISAQKKSFCEILMRTPHVQIQSVLKISHQRKFQDLVTYHCKCVK